MKRPAIILFLSVAYICFIGAGKIHAQRWQGIVLLESTRADVERIFGPSHEGLRDQYRTKTYIINVEYATGLCDDDGRGWMVPKDTVTGLHIYPNCPGEPEESKCWQKIEDLRIDESKFFKMQDPHMPAGYLRYVSSELGLIIDVSEGLVRSFRYIPSKQNNKLSCPEMRETKNIGSTSKQRQAITDCRGPGHPDSFPTHYATDCNMWRGIRPLIPSRAEVERLLGTPNKFSEADNMYEYRGDKVHVLYSGSACEAAKVGEWNVRAEWF